MKLRHVFSISIAVCIGVLGMLPLESFSEKVSDTPVSIGEFIYTVPLNKEVSPQQAGTEWYYQFLEPGANDSLFTPLLEKVRDKTLRVYSPDYPFNKIMDPDSAILRIDVPHYFEGPGENGWEVPQIYISWERKQAEEVIGITFHEEWFYDAASLTLTKKVLGIIPIVRYSMDYNLFYKNEFPVFYIPFTDGPVSSTAITVEGFTYDCQDSVYLNNSAWHCSLKNNQSQLDAQKGSRLKLLSSLKNRVKEKGMTYHSPVFPYARIMSKNEKAAVVSVLDSVDVLRLHEDWRIDINGMHFEKIIRGFSLGFEVETPGKATEPENESNFVGPPNLPRMLSYFSINNSQNSIANCSATINIPAFSYAVNYQTKENVYVNMLHSGDSLRIAEVVRDLHEKAMNGRMDIFGRKEHYFFYDPWLRNEPPLNDEEIVDRFWEKYIVLAEDTIGNYTEREMSVAYPFEDDGGFRFFEQWKFDVNAKTFSKEIVAVGITHFRISNSGEMIDPAATFFIYNNPVGRRDSILQEKYLIGRNIVYPVLINRNELYTNEDDGGRLIYDYYVSKEENIEASTRYQMVQQIIDHVLAGTMDSFDPAHPQHKLRMSEFRAMIDTIAVRNSIANIPGKEFYLFNEICFDENWYYNPATGEMAKEVNSITFTHRAGRSWLTEPNVNVSSQEGFVIRLNSGNIR